MRMRHLTLAGLMIGLLAGCTAMQNMSKSKADVHDATAEADAALVRVRQPAQELDTSDILSVKAGETFIAPAPKVVRPREALPRNCTIVIGGGVGRSLQEFAQQISRDNDCGVSVRATTDAVRALELRQQGVISASTGPALAIPMPAGVTLPSPVAGSGTSSSSGFSGGAIDISYQGQLANLLDVLTARYGLSWRPVGDSEVQIYYLDTRFYHLYSIPTTTDVESTVSSGNSIATGSSGGTGVGAGGGGASSGVSGDTSTQTVTRVGFKTDAQKDISETINKLLTPELGRMAFSPSSGMLTVTDTPEVLDTIERFVSEQNKFRTKFVMLNMQVLNVKLNSNDQLGLDWNLVYKSLSDKYGINLLSSFSADAEAMSGSINILEGNPRFNGTEMIVKALSAQGDIVNRRNPSTSTLNMDPITVQVARQTAYIASSQGTATADVGTTTTLTPGAVTAGFNMNLLPYIMPDNQTILLQLSLSISDLVQIVRTEKGDSIIESPELDNQVLNQKVRIKSGQTLILSGLETIKVNSNRTGTGSPRWWVFGGGGISKREREVLVLLVTPVIAKD